MPNARKQSKPGNIGAGFRLSYHRLGSNERAICEFFVMRKYRGQSG